MTKRTLGFLVVAISLTAIPNAASAEPSVGKHISAAWKGGDTTLLQLECGNLSDTAGALAVVWRSAAGEELGSGALEISPHGAARLEAPTEIRSQPLGSVEVNGPAIGNGVGCWLLTIRRSENQAGMPRVAGSAYSMALGEASTEPVELFLPQTPPGDSTVSLSHSVLVTNPGAASVTVAVRRPGNDRDDALEIPAHGIKEIAIASTGDREATVVVGSQQTGAVPLRVETLRHVSVPGHPAMTIALEATPKVCDSGPFILNSGPTAIELMNHNETPATVVFEILGKGGEVQLHEEQTVARKSGLSYRVSVVDVANRPVFVRVTCGGQTSGAAISTRAFHYGVNPDPVKGLLHAYSIAASVSPGVGGTLGFVTDRAGDMPSSLFVSEWDGTLSTCEVKLLNQSGALTSEQSADLIPGCVAVVRLTPQTPKDFFGLAVVSNDQGAGRLSGYMMRGVTPDPGARRISVPISGLTFLKASALSKRNEATLDPGTDVIVKLKKAQAAIGARRFAEAEAILVELTTKYPRYRCALQLLVEAYHKQGKMKEAEATLTRVLQVEPQEVYSLNMLGGLRLEQGKLDEAVDLFRRADDADPLQVYASFNLFSALAASGKLSEAQAQLERTLGVDGSFAPALVAKAQLLTQEGKTAEAKALLQRAVVRFEELLKASPNDTQLLIALGLNYDKLDRLEEAFDTASRVIAIDPKNPWGYNNAGWARHRQGRISEALGYYKTANELLPGNSIIDANVRNASAAAQNAPTNKYITPR